MLKRIEAIIITVLLWAFLAAVTYYALDNPRYSKPDEAFHEFAWRRSVAPARLMVAFSTCAAIAPARYLHPTYPRPLLIEALERLPAYPLEARFGDNEVQLLGYNLELTQQAPEQDILTITYYSRALRGSYRDGERFPDDAVPLGRLTDKKSSGAAATLPSNQDQGCAGRWSCGRHILSPEPMLLSGRWGRRGFSESARPEVL